MPYSLRHPTKLSTFLFFTALQALLFIPVVIIFTLLSDRYGSALAGAAMPNIYAALALTLIAVILFFCITQKEPASFVVPLSFAIFVPVFYMVFHIVTVWPSFEPGPDWHRYPRFVLWLYSVPMFALTAAIVSGIKIFRKVKDR